MVFGGVYGLNIKLSKFFTHGRNLVLDFNSSLSSDFTVSINFNPGVSGMREIVKETCTPSYTRPRRDIVPDLSTYHLSCH